MKPSAFKVFIVAALKPFIFAFAWFLDEMSPHRQRHVSDGSVVEWPSLFCSHRENQKRSAKLAESELRYRDAFIGIRRLIK